MKSIHAVILVLCFMFMVFGFNSCASTPKVNRVAVEEQMDLSGSWNAADSQSVSQDMIKDVLARPWISEFVSKNSEKPRLIIGAVLNKSHEHINTETFTKDLERELTNSGKVRFVASSQQRKEIRDERKEQAENASLETAKSSGQEYGADFMVKGQINTIMDEAGKMQVRYYQIELELIDIETNEKVWIGQKKIKKIIKRRGSKF